ncbi:hypothetical protein [Paenibacillus sp. QZ-Y1]|uniref:hypothetical protein n=1 Tax=Paenibacillus sp. QZ-Y1 TaxID=3414511 RepID=UPI003F7AEF0D
MSLILPMNYPVVTCYPNHSNLLSVISQNERYVDWFLDNYIQLLANKDEYKRNILRLDFYTNDLWKTCPFVQIQQISRKTIAKKYDNIIDFFRDSIREQSYVYVLVDKYYISKYQNSYKKNHYVHDIFLYGFDNDKEVFYAADNFAGGKYSYETIKFSESTDAYNHVGILNLEDWLEGIQLVTYREKNNFWGLTHYYKFDIDKLIIELSDYLTSFKTVKRYGHAYYQWMLHAADYAFGLEVYDVIINYLNATSDLNDLRPLFVLWEHKKVMLLRIKYLEENKFIHTVLSTGYIKIEQETKILMGLYLKYLLTREEKIRQRIISKLSAVRQEEEVILRNLLNLLKTSNADQLTTDKVN